MSDDDDDKIIDFIGRLSEREHAEWERERERLFACMLETNQSIDGLATAALSALIDLMVAGGMSLDAAKAQLTGRIRMFH